MNMASGSDTTSQRAFNFSAGPAVLPVSVLEQVQRELLCYPGAAASILEVSHRGKDFVAVLDSARQRLRQLLAVPDDYEVVFLQGGSRLQFSMIPMNLLTEGASADYISTGSWGKAAFQEAIKVGSIHSAWNGADEGFVRVPDDDELNLDANAAYVYFTSNETIEGVQFSTEPDVKQVPLVCDASSDFLCRPLDIRKYGLLYACAQKNAGPAGVTIVIIRKSLLERSGEELPGYLSFKQHADKDSMFNTPPTFAIYLVDLVAKWLLEEVGGLVKIYEQNCMKAKWLYEVIDESDGFYQGHAAAGARSIMNITFRLPSDALQEAFVNEAAEHRLCNLKGHRSVGGIRASIYNAMPVRGVEVLRDFMQSFWQKNR